MSNGNDNFVNLHLHTTYSLLDAYGLPEQILDKVKELKQTACAITDHGNTFGHIRFYKEALKRNIKPILGCEFYLVKNAKIKDKEEKRSHITILAKNKQGYTNLIKLVTQSWLEYFYYKPRIDIDTLLQHKEGLIVLSGCPQSFISNWKDDCEIIVEKLKAELKNDFYLEIGDWDFFEGKKIISKIIAIYKKFKIPLVVTADVHYPEKNDSSIQDILVCIRDRKKINDPTLKLYDLRNLYLKTYQEIKDSIIKFIPELSEKEIELAIANTQKIANDVDFAFENLLMPEFPLSQDKIKFFEQLCKQGLKEKKLNSSKQYIDRMEYEKKIILQKKNFLDYFLIIWDIVQYAKKKNILMSPARGSVAGCLIAYLLGITEIDPLQYNLIFERFIDINREDLPDIDLDFEDTRREEIKDYIEKKYGYEHTASLATFGTFKGKMCLQDIGRIYSLPNKEVEKLKELVLVRSGGDSRGMFCVEDTFKFDIAKKIAEQYPDFFKAAKLEGQIRNVSIHAAGVIISKTPLNNCIAFSQSHGQKILATDYDGAKYLNLLKIDILGLKTLSIIKNTLKLIEQNHNKKIDIYKDIPLDDPKVYEYFSQGKLYGIFQFEGQAVNQVCRQIKPKNINELIEVNGLARPGPLNSGATTSFINRKNKIEEIVYEHPLMKNITENTYGIVVWQEQVMRVMREIGDMSWADTAEIRKLISRAQGVEKFNTFQKKFEMGSLKKVDKNTSDKIWNAMCTFGSWAFNKSHATGYTILSYITMWLKIYYPLEYFVSLCQREDETAIKKILKEAKNEKIKILPIDINKSKQTFTIENGCLRLGFEQIKKFGKKAADELVKKQPFVNTEDFLNRIDKKIITKGKQELLYKLGIIAKNKNQLSLFPTPEKEISMEEKFQICPYLIDLNLIEKWQSFCYNTYKQKIVPIEKLNLLSNKKVAIIGLADPAEKNLRNIREVSFSKGQKLDNISNPHLEEFMNFVLEDETDFITVRISRTKYPLLKDIIWSAEAKDVLYVEGRMGMGIRMVFAEKIINLTKNYEKYQNKKNK